MEPDSTAPHHALPPESSGPGRTLSLICRGIIRASGQDITLSPTDGCASMQTAAPAELIIRNRLYLPPRMCVCDAPMQPI
jgi:hypothetical protein